MNNKLRETLNQISIPDIENEITDKNQHYFSFASDLPKCLHGKKILLQLSLMIGCFISTFFLNKYEIHYISMIVLTALICIWYLYDERYVYYYKKSAKAFLLNNNEKGMKYLYKILASKRIYINEMPMAYSILKAKQMLINNDFVAGEYLVANILKQKKECPEAKLVMGLCELQKGNLKKSVAILSTVCQRNFSFSVKSATEELIDEIHRELEI